MQVWLRLGVVLALGAFSLYGQEPARKGVHPRATADDYAVKAEAKGAAYAASLVPTEQAKQLFAVDITGKFLVFEVACFPQDGQWVELDSDDFVIKRGDKGDLTHGSDALAVAGSIQKENAPRRAESLGGDTQIHTETHVGYESGVDPVTGRRVNGTYTGAGVGVEHGGAVRPPDDPARARRRKIAGCWRHNCAIGNCRVGSMITR